MTGIKLQVNTKGWLLPARQIGQQASHFAWNETSGMLTDRCLCSVGSATKTGCHCLHWPVLFDYDMTPFLSKWIRRACSGGAGSTLSGAEHHGSSGAPQDPYLWEVFDVHSHLVCPVQVKRVK